MTSAVATIAESEVRSRGCLRLGWSAPVGADRDRRAFERPEAGESHAEERAPPLRQQRLDELDVLSLERVADLGGDVARLAERRDELGMEGLAARRRVDADGELGSRVEAVLELGQLVEESVRDAFGGGLGDPLEPCERGAYSLPQMRDGFRITPRLVPSNRPLHRDAHHIRSRSAATGGGLGGTSIEASGAEGGRFISSSVALDPVPPAKRPEHDQDRAEADGDVHDRDHELLAEAEGEDRRAGGGAGQGEDEDGLLRARRPRA